MSSRVVPPLACAMLVFACGVEPAQTTSPDASMPSQPLTLARDIQPILDMYCVRCHAYGAGDPHGEPHFTRDQSERAFETASDCTSGGARIELVVPGKPESSFLLYKLGAETNVTVAGTMCGQTMPLDSDEPLALSDPDAVARVRQWILDGAR